MKLYIMSLTLRKISIQFIDTTVHSMFIICLKLAHTHEIMILNVGEDEE
jgi:hypothetical protein